MAIAFSQPIILYLNVTALEITGQAGGKKKEKPPFNI